MKKIVLGAPGITGESPELPMPAILEIKGKDKISTPPTTKGHRPKKESRSRRNLLGGK